MKTGKMIFGCWCLILFMATTFQFVNAQLETKLVPEDGVAGDLFGRANDVSFYYSAVGAADDDNENGDIAGAVYVYKREGTSRVFTQKVIASDGAADDMFGTTVAITRNYLVVGSPWDDDAGEKSGSAYVFKRNDEVWEEVAKLTADDAGEDNRFGINVKITSDECYIIVGAFFDDDFGDRTGSVYIYHRNESNEWVQTQKILANDAAAGDWFGTSLDVYENYLAVGARDDDNENGVDAGGVYLYKQTDGSYNFLTKIIADDGADSDHFYQVALYGHYLAVGAFWDDDKGSNSGSVYMYKRRIDEFQFDQKIVAPDSGDLPGDEFGRSVDIWGNRLIIGAYKNDEWGEDAGKAYLFRHDGTSWDLKRVIVPVDVQAGDWFGLPVSIAHNTILTSSRQSDVNGENSGAAYSMFFYSRIITVSPDGPNTISEVMAGCDFGDNIKLEAGTYNESIVMQPGVDLFSAEGVADKVSISMSGVNSIIRTAPDAGIWDITITDNANPNQQPGHGIYSFDDNARIHNCIIKNCNTGIYLAENSCAIIYNNTIDNNQVDGIYMQKEGGPEVYNNIFTNNLRAAIYRQSHLPNTPPTIEYNCYFGNTTDYGFFSSPWMPGEGTGELFEDPLFVGGTPFDYHLSQNSPCIDAGRPTSIKDDDGTIADLGALFYYHVTNVEELSAIQATAYELFSAYPNPFNPQTTIAFQLMNTAHVELAVYNVLGQEVTILVSQKMAPGKHKAVWNGSDALGQSVPSGIYFYRLEIKADAKNSGFVDVKKMILAK